MASAQDTQPTATPNLSVDVVARCTRDAQQDGIFAGLSAGLVGAIIGQRFYRFDRNKTILCGVVTGILAGYQFSQVFMASNLARVRKEQAQLAQTNETEAPERF